MMRTSNYLAFADKVRPETCPCPVFSLLLPGMGKPVALRANPLRVRERRFSTPAPVPGSVVFAKR